MPVADVAPSVTLSSAVFFAPSAMARRTAVFTYLWYTLRASMVTVSTPPSRAVSWTCKSALVVLSRWRLTAEATMIA